MEPIYVKHYEISDMNVDRFGRLKPAMILFFAQDVATHHCDLLAVDYDTLLKQRLFWAVTRHRVQITRLPRRGETIRVETWPMPTTRVAYPRSIIAYDEQGRECFRAISLWVLMDLDTRNMILPGKSGISVEGTLRGGELALPGSLIPRKMGSTAFRQVCFSDLDRNGHMNNTRCLDWAADLMPSAFHGSRSLTECTVCYLSEAREGENLRLTWELTQEGVFQVDAHRSEDGKDQRVFSVKMAYDTIEN